MKRKNSIIAVMMLICMIIAGFTIDGYSQEKSNMPEGPVAQQTPTVKQPYMNPRAKRLGVVVIADLNVTPLEYTGTCPAVFTLKGKIYANKAMTVLYKIVRSDNTPMKAIALTFEKEDRKEITYTWQVDNPARSATINEWALIEVVYPINAKNRSNAVFLKGSCTSQTDSKQQDALSQKGSVPTNTVMPQASLNRLPEAAQQERCISFDPATAAVQQIQGAWSIVDGSSKLFNFSIDKVEADNSLAIIKHYTLNRSCFVGSPRPSFHYMLAGNAAPIGPFSGEDCRSFNPATTNVQQIKDNWTIADGDHLLFDFGADKTGADQAIAIIKKYGFTYSCMMARGRVDFVYLRK